MSYQSSRELAEELVNDMTHEEVFKALSKRNRHVFDDAMESLRESLIVSYENEFENPPEND